MSVSRGPIALQWPYSNASVSLLYAQILAIREHDSAYAHDSVLFSHGQRDGRNRSIHTYCTYRCKFCDHTGQTRPDSPSPSFYSGTQAGLPRELRLQWQPARAFSSGTILPLSIRVMMDLRLRLNNHWSVVVRVGEACQ